MRWAWMAAPLLIVCGPRADSQTATAPASPVAAPARTSESADPITWFTFMLVLVGVGQIVVYWKQKGVMEKALAATEMAANAASASANAAIEQIGLTRRQFEAEHRPWVAVNLELAGGISWDVNGLVIPLYATFRNVGKSPAIYYLQLASPSEDDGLQSRQRIMNACGHVDETLEHFYDTLFPGATNGERINLSISNDQIQQQWERYRIKWQRDKVWKILTPIFVVCVGYKTPLVDRVFHTGEVYELSGKVPGKPGVRVALNFDDGNVSIGVEHLILERSVPQGGYAD